MSIVWTIVLFASLCHGVSRATNCVSRGRFPNDEFSGCRGYTTCLAGAGDVFYKYDLACPETFIYNHIDSQCTNATSYACLSAYNCTQVGSFENPNTTNCSSYIACIEGLNGIVTARLIKCEPDTVFSPSQTSCVMKSVYMCPSGNTDIPPDVSETVDEHNIPNTDDNSSAFPAIHYMPFILVLTLIMLFL